MKYISSSPLLSVLLLLLPHFGQAQETPPETPAAGGFSSMVLVGAISASVTEESMDFSNLPSGMVLRVGANGVEVVQAADVGEVDPATPRVGVGSIDQIPAQQQAALARRFRGVYDQLMIAYDDGTVSEDDTIAIVKFFLSLDLPYDETFRGNIEDRFGPLVDDTTGEAVGLLIEETGDPTQVTNPIDLNTGYFAP